jgi:hypothetical protein
VSGEPRVDQNSLTTEEAKKDDAPMLKRKPPDFCDRLKLSIESYSLSLLHALRPIAVRAYGCWLLSNTGICQKIGWNQ